MANEHEEQEQEKAYEVKDKRRVNADGTMKEETAEAEQATPQAEEAKTEAPEEPTGAPSAEQAEIPPPNVYAILQFVLGLLAEQAWELMGIRLAPGQKEEVRDLTQAKVAIDTIVFIADKLHPNLGEEERKALRGLISDLQINFVQQSSKQQ